MNCREWGNKRAANARILLILMFFWMPFLIPGMIMDYGFGRTMKAAKVESADMLKMFVLGRIY